MFTLRGLMPSLGRSVLGRLGGRIAGLLHGASCLQQAGDRCLVCHVVPGVTRGGGSATSLAGLPFSGPLALIDIRTQASNLV